MSRTWGAFRLSFAIAALVLAAGCNKASTRGEKAPDGTGSGASEGEHGHKPGNHGGSIVHIGRDNYHAEAVFGDKGEVTLYMLAQDEAQVQEVESQILTASAKAEGE